MMQRRLAAIAVAALLVRESGTGAGQAAAARAPASTAPSRRTPCPSWAAASRASRSISSPRSAQRMKREITIDAVSFSTLIPGMQSGRYDFIAAPTTVTKERAENMLFTAGYLWTAFQFGIKKGSPPIKGWEDLKGKVGVRQQGHALRDADQGRWARSTASPCRSTTPSPTRRRPCSRAAPTPRSAATPRSSTPRRKNPQFVADLELKDTRAHWAAPVPQGQRGAAQPDAGRARLHEEGRHHRQARPRSGSARSRTPTSSRVVITPGYGVPGMPGYDPTPHELKCG